MKFSFLFITLSLISYRCSCCMTCNLQLRREIVNSTFFPNLFTMLSAFIVLALIVILLVYLSNKKHIKLANSNLSGFVLNPVPLKTTAVVLGIGIGGFIDGILFHQILQWHEMISNKIPPVTLLAKSVNMFWDGLFHAFNLVVVIIGIGLLWKLLKRNDIDKSGNLFFGGLLWGWGLFNIVEGVINHHILKLHFVRDYTTQTEVWNYGFLLTSALISFSGYCIALKLPTSKLPTNFNTK